MKKIVTILLTALFVVGVLLVQELRAQAPSKMSYQTLVRNASNAFVANQQIGMQISILKGSATGTAAYVETHTPTSNAGGLVSIEIGSGTSTSGDFSTIDWSSDTYFIKTEVDLAGGTDYTITGTSQLLSVAYALYAKTAGNAFSGSYNDLTDVPAGSSFDGKFSGLSDVPTGLSDGDDNTQLSETQVDAFVANNGYLTTEVDGSITNEIELPTQTGHSGKVLTTNGTDPSWSTVSFNDLTDVPASVGFDGEFSSLSNVPTGLSDGDDNTQLNETQVDAFVANNGYLTAEVDGSITNEIELPTQTGQSGKILTTDGSSPSWSTINFSSLSSIPSGLSDGDDNTQLNETQVDAFVANNGYLTAEVDGSTTNEIELPAQTGQSGKILTTDGSSPSWSTINFSSLSSIPSGLSDGDDNTQLNETQVDAFVANNGYLTSFTEVDGSITNELELPSQSGQAGKYLTTNGTSVSWETVAGSGSPSVRTISANTTLDASDEIVFINGAFTATLPASPTDGMRVVLCSTNQSAGVNGNGRLIYLSATSLASLTFADATVNSYIMYYSSTLNAWFSTL